MNFKSINKVLDLKKKFYKNPTRRCLSNWVKRYLVNSAPTKLGTGCTYEEENIIVLNWQKFVHDNIKYHVYVIKIRKPIGAR